MPCLRAQPIPKRLYFEITVISKRFLTSVGECNLLLIKTVGPLSFEETIACEELALSNIKSERKFFFPFELDHY